MNERRLGVQVTDCREVLFNCVYLSARTVYLHFLHCLPETRRAEMSRRTDVSILHVRRFTASNFAGDGTGISASNSEKVVLLFQVGFVCGDFAGSERIGRNIKIVVAFHRFIFDGVLSFCHAPRSIKRQRRSRKDDRDSCLNIHIHARRSGI